MEPLRFAILGTGFWARYQLAAWRELDGARCVALCNRTVEKARALADEFGIERVYDDPRKMLDAEKLDFVDVISASAVHRSHVSLVAGRHVPVICQKPLADSRTDAESMVSDCRRRDVKLLVHENWRWQAPIRGVKGALDTGEIGRPFRARIVYANSFPVFENQPALRDVDKFILADMGSHILDVARFLFGEAESVYCLTDRIHEDIRGEDVATVTMRMGEATVVCELSYASRVEHDRFPETFLHIEGTEGSIELGPDYCVRVTAADGLDVTYCPPAHYDWADPQYALVHASLVPCCENLLADLRGEARAETTGEDNLETVRLVYAAYESAQMRRIVRP